VHEYDAMRWLVGAEVTRVYAQSHFGLLTGQGFQVEDATAAVLNFANGALGMSEINWIMPRGAIASDWRVDVTGDKGSVHISHNPTLVKSDAQRTSSIDALFTPVVNGKQVGSFVEELRSFLDCVATGQKPQVTGDDGLEAVRIVLAVEKSASTGQPVDLATIE
jgi:predicted dehydrogenase